MSRARSGSASSRTTQSRGGGELEGGSPRSIDEARLIGAGQGLCAAAAVVGATALVGWLSGAMVLAKVFPRSPPMAPDTGIGLVLAGTAGALLARKSIRLRTRRLSRLAVWIVLVLGATTLIEYLAHRGFRADFIPFPERSGGHPTRPSPATAVSMTLIAGALLLLDTRAGARRHPSEWLTLGASLTVFSDYLWHLFGAGLIVGSTHLAATPTGSFAALGLLLVSLGVLYLRPQASFMRILTSTGPGGLLLRRLGIAAVILPASTGFVVEHFLTRDGLSDLPSVLAAVSVAATAATVALLFAMAVRLERARATQVHLEEALRLSEARASGIVLTSADAIISVDEDGRITSFNQGAVNIFGYAEDEAVGQPLDTLIPEQLRAIHHERLDEFAQSDSSSRTLGDSRAPVAFLRKDGTEFSASGSISRIEVGGQTILTISLRDISEQKRFQSDQAMLVDMGAALAGSLHLDETLRKLATLVAERVTDFCIVDVVEDGRLRRREVACCDPEQAELCEYLQKNPLEPSRSPVLEEVLDSREPALINDPTPEMIARYARDDEHRRAIEQLAARGVIVAPMVARDELMGLLTLISKGPPLGPADLRLARQLAGRAAVAVDNARLYREAERAVEARDDLLRIVAHDLRSPLNGVLLQAEILREALTDPDEPTRRSVGTIERAARRMARLVGDLLDVSSLESGQLSMEKVPVSPRDVVRESAAAFEDLAASAGLDLRADLGDDLPELRADPDRMQQVFENLIGNAIKFTDPGGFVEVGVRSRGDEVLFWVSDSGPGIAEDDQEHVFDLYWQGQAGQRRGAGLGLPIVKGIVEAHDGHVWLDSEPGVGSTFFFAIPCPSLGRSSGDEKTVTASRLS